MFEQDSIHHHIERSIINYLTFREYARFSEMRPKNVDTNLFAYHLKVLLKTGYIIKNSEGYTLGKKGLVYVDRVNIEKMKLRTQPKIITMLLAKNDYGKILIQKRLKQPYINTWTLPYGKLHIDDKSVIDAAIRESNDKLSYVPTNPCHIGDCYIITRQDGSGSLNPTDFSIESRTLAHIVRIDANEISVNENLRWIDTSELVSITLAPAVEQIIAKASLDGGFFFSEFNVTAR